MPKVTLQQQNFTAGEMSPKLYGRTDIARYQNGAEAVRDLIVQVYGGVKRRPASLYVAPTKDAAARSRLIPFVKDADTAYVLEFGDTYMRVFKDGAQVESGGNPYEVVSPYTTAQVLEMDYTQGADTMFLFHGDVEPHRLVCAGDTSWTLEPVPFIETPFEEPGTFPAKTLTPSTATPYGAACNLSMSSPGIFAGSLIGHFIKINGGILKIESVTDAENAVARIQQDLIGVTAASPNAWSLHAPAWSASRGYPRTGTLYEQRLVVAGTPTFPQTIWGSVIGAYLDFALGTNDDDAFSFTIASDIASPIRYLAPNRLLQALASGGEFTIEGGVEKPLAPTNARIKHRSNYGCAQVRPVRIRDTEMFVQRAGRKLRSFAYSIENDDWKAPDLSVLAEHLTEGGIVDMSWQQEPDSIIWLARADGGLVSVTLDRDQDVTGWSWHEEFSFDENGTQRAWVESMTSVPADGSDQLWLVVRRTVDGDTVRYVERMSEDTTCDCSVVASGAAATVWGGLDHLEGETVHVVGDGFYRGSYTVTAGEVTLEREASEVVMGLNFRPRLKLLPPEIQTGMGASAGNAMRTSEVTVRFFETTGCEVNGSRVTFRRTGPDALDQPPELFTGVKRIENLGFERGESELEFVQPHPMPIHILSITRKFTTNEG